MRLRRIAAPPAPPPAAPSGAPRPRALRAPPPFSFLPNAEKLPFFFSRNRSRHRLPMCSRSGRLRRGRPLRIRSDRLPLSDMASRACSKPVGAILYARGAGPSTPSLVDQRERVGHYREQAVASPRLHSRRWYQRVTRPIIDMRPALSTFAIVFVHQHSLRSSAEWRRTLRGC
jgi:hypothetical protein